MGASSENHSNGEMCPQVLQYTTEKGQWVAEDMLGAGS